MNRPRFIEPEIVEILKDGDAGMAVADILRKHGISRQTYFTWKAKYGGSPLRELRRLKELEAENRRQQRLYAEVAIQEAAGKDILHRNL